MIDFNKPVRMKSGARVDILSTHLMGSYPILGKSQGEYCVWKGDGSCLPVGSYPILGKSQGEYCVWKGDGSCLPDGYAPEDDLENVPKEKEVWLNVYKSNMVCSSPNREEADNCSKTGGRIARIKIILKDVEGRFDE